MNPYRLAWATDIHLNFVDGDAGPLCDLVTQTGAGGLVITGDISEAKTIEQDLAAIESLLSLPICAGLAVNSSGRHGDEE